MKKILTFILLLTSVVVVNADCLDVFQSNWNEQQENYLANKDSCEDRSTMASMLCKSEASVQNQEAKTRIVNDYMKCEFGWSPP